MAHNQKVNTKRISCGYNQSDILIQMYILSLSHQLSSLFFVLSQALYLHPALVPAHHYSSSLQLSGHIIIIRKALHPPESLKLDISSYLSTHATNDRRYLPSSASLLRLSAPSAPHFPSIFQVGSNSNSRKRMHSTCRLTIKAIWFEYVTMSLPFQLN